MTTPENLEITMDVLIREIHKLISLPDIYYRLEDLIESDQASMSDISQLLGAEPDLCARLLKLANSAFYSFPVKIVSIEQAVQTIGTGPIRELVMATSIVKVFSNLPLGMVSMPSFWKHSISVGILSKELAVMAGIPNRERIYVCGLLHDLGRLLLYLKLPGLMHELLIQREIREVLLYELEHQHLNYSHAELGARLLEVWQIPQSIWEPVAHHHDPARAMEHHQTACLVNIADSWINRQRMGTSGETFVPEVKAETWQEVNLEPEQLEQAWPEIKGRLKTMVGQFLSH